MSESKDKEEKLEYDSPELDEDTKRLLTELKNATGSGIVTIEEKDMYYVALQMYKNDPKILPLISDLTKEHIEILTKHDTWIKSCAMLFDLEPNDTAFQPLIEMRNSFLMYNISKTRKSRTEIVNILSNKIGDLSRTINDKLLGRVR